MNIKSKKMDMADKMYKENGAGGKGMSSKYKQSSKAVGGDVPMNQSMTSKGSNRTSPKYAQVDAKGKITGKYNQG